MSRRQSSRARSRANTLFLATAVINGAAFGQVTSWVGPASGNWSNAANWSNGLPNGGGFTAMVDNGQAYNCVVTLDGNYSVGTLNISPNDQVTLLRDDFNSIYSHENWVPQSGEWIRTGTETQGMFVQSSLASGVP